MMKIKDREVGECSKIDNRMVVNIFEEWWCRGDRGVESLEEEIDLNKIVKFLESYGYSPEFHQYPMGHELSLQSINDLGKWINSFNDDQ